MTAVCIVGAGFIGTNLARHLLARGERVRLFGHPPPWPEALEGVGRPYHVISPVALPAVEARRGDGLHASVGGGLALFDRALVGLGEYDREARVSNTGSGEGRSLAEMISQVEAAIGRLLRFEWWPGRPRDVRANVLDIRRAREEWRGGGADA